MVRTVHPFGHTRSGMSPLSFKAGSSRFSTCAPRVRTVGVQVASPNQAPRVKVAPSKKAPSMNVAPSKKVRR